MAETIVKTPSGKIRGKIEKSRDGNSFVYFKGIRYGCSSRFELATLAPGWEDIYDATGIGNIPHQLDDSNPNGIDERSSEDCLFLNISVPVEISKKVPVIVWIHGGSYISGFGDMYEPNYMMDENVVLVTINYRLGPFGFLNTEDGIFHANLGLKDQSLALRWIQKNIDCFGGDKHNVTLHGQSSGASAAVFHMLSPMSKGLFHKVIASGETVFSAVALDQNPQSIAFKLGEKLGLVTNDSEELKSFLKTVDPIKILELEFEEEPECWDLDAAGFMPSVECIPKNASSVFLPDAPTAIFRSGNYNKVPLMIGNNRGEGKLFYSDIIKEDDKLLKTLMDNWNDIAPITFGLRQYISNKNLTKAGEDLRQFYTEQLNDENWLEYVYTDTGFNIPVVMTIYFHGKYGPVFPFIFDKLGKQSLLNFYGLKTSSAPTHMDEIQYLYPNSYFETDIPKNSEDYNFSKKFVKLIVSFAKDSKPTWPWADSFWPQTSEEEINKRKPLQWFIIKDQPEHNDGGFQHRLAWWHQFLEKYEEYLSVEHVSKKILYRNKDRKDPRKPTKIPKIVKQARVNLLAVSAFSGKFNAFKKH